ncbi:MAG: hypothetical protein FJ077_01265 [Cyanobacteria bacterium K_DeepCast_35m_m2_023]|nr:hypothetical protein [Cyanobacteria bacterium K_DeepCast_35m_m2_023]
MGVGVAEVERGGVVPPDPPALELALRLLLALVVTVRRDAADRDALRLPLVAAGSVLAAAGSTSGVTTCGSVGAG